MSFYPIIDTGRLKHQGLDGLNHVAPYKASDLRSGNPESHTAKRQTRQVNVRLSAAIMDLAGYTESDVADMQSTDTRMLYIAAASNLTRTIASER
jgi:hypothetical protein